MVNVQTWFRTQEVHRTLREEWEIAERMWVVFPPGGPRPNGKELAAAGVPISAWSTYQRLSGSVPLTSHQVAILYRAGLTPALCKQLLDRQDTRDIPESLNPITVLAVEVEAMLDNGVPPSLAGLYALAGYDANEAAATHRTGTVATATLQVQVQLAM